MIKDYVGWVELCYLEVSEAKPTEFSFTQLNLRYARYTQDGNKLDFLRNQNSRGTSPSKPQRDDINIARGTAPGKPQRGDINKACVSTR